MRITSFTLILFFVFVPFLHAQLSETAVWTTLLSSQYRVAPNITYSVANNYECKLDVYARRATPAPTLIYIHGGGWVAGTKDNAVLGILPFLEMGFSVVNVGYRLGKVSPAPAAVEDCRLALRWVYKNAKEFGFDTTRIVVTGGSAGGHLALMTGMLHPGAGFDTPKDWDTQQLNLKVAAVVNFFGITDVADLLSGPNRQEYAVSWIGNQENGASVAKRVSPLTYVRKGLSPILTIHGNNDQLVPYSHAVRLHDALTKAGIRNELLTIPGGMHGGFTDDEMKKIFQTIRDFLGAQGVLK
ncbi:MAG: alpha/beta hydrolase [Bacteroidota bacterium]